MDEQPIEQPTEQSLPVVEMPNRLTTNGGDFVLLGSPDFYVEVIRVILHLKS